MKHSLRLSLHCIAMTGALFLAGCTAPMPLSGGHERCLQQRCCEMRSAQRSIDGETVNYYQCASAGGDCPSAGCAVGCACSLWHWRPGDATMERAEYGNDPNVPNQHRGEATHRHTCVCVRQAN